MRDRFTIMDWARDERPREKFLARGAGSLSDAELLAILIRAGNKDENAIDLARKILRGAGNSLKNLGRFSFEDLKKFKGIGIGKALSIMAAFELARRGQVENATPLSQIYSSSAAAENVVPMLKDLQHEECWVLYLNKSNKLLGRERVFIGGFDSTVVDIRIILRNALARNACHIILVHNHPSGNKMAGEADKIQTEKLKKAAKMCDIELIDHLIVAGGNYFSFADEGLL
ncbi:MAG: DNA repair protein RadC [Bacteroidales bacterium]|nr:DNA repair protein RadC [Bacteroidales bacterium]